LINYDILMQAGHIDISRPDNNCMPETILWEEEKGRLVESAGDYFTLYREEISK